jgi:cytochrome c
MRRIDSADGIATGLRHVGRIGGIVPCALAVLAFVFATAGAAAADAPPPSFALCMACHASGQGAPSRAGPNLFGIVGRPAGTYVGFNYSAAMKSSGIVWTAEELDRFLTSPQTRVPGTAMTLFGIDDPASRKEIIDYLQTLK